MEPDQIAGLVIFCGFAVMMLAGGDYPPASTWWRFIGAGLMALGVVSFMAVKAFSA